MSTLALADDIREDVNAALHRLSPIPPDATRAEEFQGEVDGLVRSDPVLKEVGAVLRALLDENGFVHLCGLPDTSDLRAIVVLGSVLGQLFTDLSHQSRVVVEASPAPGATLQGNRTGTLFPHTDFAMLERPPAVTVIRCVAEDPLGPPFGCNGVFLAQDIVDRFYGTAWLPLLWTVPLPLAGRKPAGEDVLFSAPALDVDEATLEVRSVRFHPSRIHHGFRVRGSGPSGDEAAAMHHLIEAARAVRQEVYLKAGDCLLVANRVAMHDRGRCSLRLSRSGLQSRVSQILFVQECHSS
jgi:alpha-ketoglutarate-dependent taurine dioxygenase